MNNKLYGRVSYMRVYQYNEDVATALLNLLQKERIDVVIDGKTLTGKEALKLRVDKIMKGKFQYRDS